jgi:hypothetical protein
MAMPLEKESKMWGLFYSSDFHKLMFVFIGNAFLFLVVFIYGGLEAALVIFFAVLAVATVYFVIKSFWPDKHLENILRYRKEPKRYFPGKEESEVEHEK